MELSSCVLVAVQDEKYFRWVFLDELATETQQTVFLCSIVVVVRVPVVGIPSRLPLSCCMFATVAITTPDTS